MPSVRVSRRSKKTCSVGVLKKLVGSTAGRRDHCGGRYANVSLTTANDSETVSARPDAQVVSNSRKKFLLPSDSIRIPAPTMYHLCHQASIAVSTKESAEYLMDFPMAWLLTNRTLRPVYMQLELSRLQNLSRVACRQ